MENREQTLTRAIIKAIENGWDQYPYLYPLYTRHQLEGYEFDEIEIREYHARSFYNYKMSEINGTKKIIFQNGNYYELLFNHDFAKALFGRRHVCLGCYAGDDDKYMRTKFSTHGLTCLDCDGLDHEPRWMYHIKRMVISEDPIKYMSDNITSLHDFKIPEQSKNI